MITSSEMYLPAPRPRPVRGELIGVSAPAIIDPFDLNEALVKNGPGIHQGGVVRRNINLLGRFEPPSSWDNIDNDSKHRQWGDVFQIALAARWLPNFHRFGRWKLVEMEIPSPLGGLYIGMARRIWLVSLSEPAAQASRASANVAIDWSSLDPDISSQLIRRARFFPEPDFIRTFWPEHLAAALKTVNFRGLAAVAAQMSRFRKFAGIGLWEKFRRANDHGWIEAALADAWLLLAHEKFRGSQEFVRDALEFGQKHRAKLGIAEREDDVAADSVTLNPSLRRIGVERIITVGMEKHLNQLDLEFQVQRKWLAMKMKKNVRLVNRSFSSAGTTAAQLLSSEGESLTLLRRS